MNINDSINIPIIESINNKEKQKNPKRIEWLNIFSKGFIVQSIDNNYKNQNIKIKAYNKKTLNKRNIIPRNLTTIFFNKGIKSNISNSNLSSKKTNFSLVINDEDDCYNKNKLLIANISNINKNFTERIIKKENIKKNNEKNNHTYKKEIKNKNNSVRIIKYNKPEKNTIKDKKINNCNYNKYTYKHKSIKMNSKISLKKDIHSPLLNYLDSINKKVNKNNKKVLNKTNNNYINSYSKSGLNLSTYKDNNNNKNKNKKPKYRYSKSIKEIKINNINLIEIQKYMIEGRKFKKQKNLYGHNNDSREIIDYTFDDDDEEEENDKLTITERNNIIAFSDICNPTNNYMTNNKNELNDFFGEIIGNKNKKNNKIDKIKQILEDRKILNI